MLDKLVVAFPENLAGMCEKRNDCLSYLSCRAQPGAFKLSNAEHSVWHNSKLLIGSSRN